jgi:stage IV sporulation protein FB
MIPVRIQPLFWVFAALIGWMSSGTLFGTLAWVGIIFFSVLFHEYGHAFTAVCFKQRASIQLVALGGLTTFDGPKLKSWQRFLIVLNGPLFGFGLFVIATVLLQYSWTPILMAIFRATQVANLFWTVVNLFPVLPLDGGQLLRIVLEALFGVKGLKLALLVGAVISSVCTLGFLLLQQYLAAALFALFAFQGFSSGGKTVRYNRATKTRQSSSSFCKQRLHSPIKKSVRLRNCFEKCVRKPSRECYFWERRSI